MRCWEDRRPGVQRPAFSDREPHSLPRGPIPRDAGALPHGRAGEGARARFSRRLQTGAGAAIPSDNPGHRAPCRAVGRPGADESQPAGGSGGHAGGPCPTRPATSWPGRSGVSTTSASPSLTMRHVGRHSLASWLHNDLVTTVVLRGGNSGAVEGQAGRQISLHLSLTSPAALSVCDGAISGMKPT
jgi:hypothetical protein